MSLDEVGIDLRSEIRGFHFPLNVYAELLRLETGRVDYLHYGLFQSGEHDVALAQRRHTEVVLEKLPPAPSSILEVGIGMGTMLAELVTLGYQVTGVTPDPAQIRIARAKAPSASLSETPFESFTSNQRYDLILFQESSQYIDAGVLFAQAERYCAAGGEVLIIDEFSVGGTGGLQALEYALSSAERFGFALRESMDLSAQASRTVDYLLDAVERRRQQLEQNLGLAPDALASLQASNTRYRKQYAEGCYQYRCLTFSVG